MSGRETYRCFTLERLEEASQVASLSNFLRNNFIEQVFRGNRCWIDWKLKMFRVDIFRRKREKSRIKKAFIVILK